MGVHGGFGEYGEAYSCFCRQPWAFRLWSEGDGIGGQASYDPKGLLKLYVYGGDNESKSSRKLAKSCRVNVEVKWIFGGAEQKFWTIADFRQDNIDSLKKIFNEFNKWLTGTMEWRF